MSGANARAAGESSLQTLEHTGDVWRDVVGLGAGGETQTRVPPRSIWHACTLAEMRVWLEHGRIPAPVRGCETAGDAEQVGRRTGRTVLIRLRMPASGEGMRWSQPTAAEPGFWLLDRDYEI